MLNNVLCLYPGLLIVPVGIEIKIQHAAANRKFTFNRTSRN